MWKVEKIVKKGDYLYAVVKGHPNANRYGYVLHHRIIMESSLGRLLNSDEVVHHLNNDKHDNRIENLQVMTSAEHAILHGSVGRKMCKFRCPACSTLFVRRKGQTHLVKGGRATFCSRKCSGIFSRQEQLCGQTTEMDRAISVNLVVEFHSTDNAEQTVTTGCVETVRPTPEMVKTQSSQQAD